MSTLSKLKQYMKGQTTLLPLSLGLSALSAITGMAPYILIWLIAREFLNTTGDYSSSKITNYTVWAASLAITSIALYFLALSASHLAAFRVETNMRRIAMKRLVKMPLGFFDTHTSGRIRKIIDDNASITHSFLAHQMPDLAGTIIIPITAIVMILLFDWRLGLVCLIPVMISIVLMGSMMGKRGRYFMQTYMDSLEEMNSEAVEYVRGIPVVKVFQQTVYSFKNFFNSINKYKEMVSSYTKMWQIPMSFYTIIINGFAFFLIPAAIIILTNRNEFVTVIIDMFLYLLVTPLFSQSIMRSMHLGQAISQAKEAINRLESLTLRSPIDETKITKAILHHTICFENVSFTYPDANKKAVDSVSFEIPEGNTLALVGASGGGKTTIARLIPRFWDATEGEVKIGGINVKELAQVDLMKNISFVFQNNKLFKTTILENIRYGTPLASLDKVNKAVDLAQCREIIDRLPLGLETKIGIEGTYLSGGEQQRIVLARAILKNAPIIVLDEATAFTDPENEHLIQIALKKLTLGKTVLMIAHRLTSVTNADRILVIDEGKIMEQGTHQSLLRQNGLYSKMWGEYQKSVQWTIS